MDLSRVEDVYSKIHLIYHRNKNQHGRSAWWRWLSMLRRALLKLLSTEYERQARISEYLHSRIIPKCYIAFSTVVADGQFSTLGSVLIAALAQTRNVTSLGGGKSQADSVNDTWKYKASGGHIDDLGEPISRPTEKPVVLQTSKKDALLLSDHQSTTQQKRIKSKAKKSRPANAIDDIFNIIK